VFVVVLTNSRGFDFGVFYISLHNFGGLIIGLMIGVSVILIGNHLRESDLDVLPSVFTLYLSFIAVFVLGAIIRFKLEDLNYFIVGTIVGGGAIVIWRGIPKALLAKRYNPWTVKGKEDHQDIAREYLAEEVGLSADEIEYILDNTSFVSKLVDGNYVFNHYVDGVYFSAVTRGNVSASPTQISSAVGRPSLGESKNLSTKESSVLAKRLRATLKRKDKLSAGDASQQDNKEKTADTESSLAKRLQQW